MFRMNWFPAWFYNLLADFDTHLPVQWLVFHWWVGISETLVLASWDDFGHPDMSCPFFWGVRITLILIYLFDLFIFNIKEMKHVNFILERVSIAEIAGSLAGYFCCWSFLGVGLAEFWLFGVFFGTIQAVTSSSRNQVMESRKARGNVHWFQFCNNLILEWS